MPTTEYAPTLLEQLHAINTLLMDHDVEGLGTYAKIETLLAERLALRAEVARLRKE